MHVRSSSASSPLPLVCACASLIASIGLGGAANAQLKVTDETKISVDSGGWAGLDNGDILGVAMASLGDLDGDTHSDLAVTAYGDDDAGLSAGAVWILFLNGDGTVSSQQKITENVGGFGGNLGQNSGFGVSLCALGDLDGDGVCDLAVGEYDGRGAVWILFLNADGTVKAEQEIGFGAGGFTGTLALDEHFGRSLAALGDLDGDGVIELAVGSIGDDGGIDRGAVWILFLNANGTVKSHQKISDTAGGFDGVLFNTDVFGIALCELGDLDNDGVVDLGVGSGWGGGGDCLWILFLNSDGTVESERRIDQTGGGFLPTMSPNTDGFGQSLALLGDVDGDGVVDIAVGAPGDNDTGVYQGAVWILFLRADGTVKSTCKFGEGLHGFHGDLSSGDQFAFALAPLFEADGDPLLGIVCGANGHRVAGEQAGAVWTLFLADERQKFQASGAPLGSVIVSYPLSAGPAFPPVAQADVLSFSYPASEPILTLQALAASVEISDGRTSLALGSVAAGEPVRTLFADLARLFPDSTPATRFELRARLDGVAGRVGALSFHGGVELRNGSGANEVCLVSASTPRAGARWEAWIDVSRHPTARASGLWVTARPLAGRRTALGELLIDGDAVCFGALARSCGTTHVHAFVLPPTLAGHSFTAQAVILDEHGASLGNALDFVVR